jgi:hypothetical protein
MALFNRFVRLLREADWKCATDAPEGRLILTVTASNGRHLISIQVREESQFIVALMPYARKAQYSVRRRMVQFMNKTNFALHLGGFEMDPDDGELRFRNSIDVESLALTREFVDNFVRTFAVLGARYRTAVEMILDGRSVQEAYDAVS